MSSITPQVRRFNTAEEACAFLQQQNKELVERMQQLDAHANAIVTVIGYGRPGRVIITTTPLAEVLAIEGVKVGSQIRVIPESNQGYEVYPEPIAFGSVVTVLTRDGSHALVESMTSKSLLPIAEGLQVSAGDRVALDPTNLIVLRKLPESDQRFALQTAQAVRWEDVIGQDEAVEALREAVEYPVRFREVYEAHGQKPAKGALLYGPPGCGKTLLAKALATAVADDLQGFIYVKGSEVSAKFVGESERNIRSMFDQARRFKAKTGRPAVIFLDEGDAVLRDRARSGLSFGGNVPALVETFLAEMDGLDDTGAFVLIATNKPELIDSAVVREGRCDQKVYVRRPDEKAAEALFRHAFRSRRCDAESLAKVASEELFDARHKLLELTYKGVNLPEIVSLRALASGAMIEGIVQKAAASAIQRDRESGTLSEIEIGDVVKATTATLRQQARLNHDALIADISAPYGRLPEKVRKLIDG